MPNGWSAKEFFNSPDNSEYNFLNDVLNFTANESLPKGPEGVNLEFTRVDPDFKAEHNRFFFLE